MRRQAVWSAILVILLTSASAAGEVGWYLMVPPVTPAPNPMAAPKVDRHIPLSQWRQDGAFDTARECSEWRAMQFHMLNTQTTDAIRHGDDFQGLQASMIAYGNGLCIASNDPRLAPSR